MGFDEAERELDEYRRQIQIAESYLGRSPGYPTGNHTAGEKPVNAAPRSGTFSCFVLSFLMVGGCFFVSLPSMLLIMVCRILGIPLHWGVRLVVMGATVVFVRHLYREWNRWRRSAEAYGIQSFYEWRARRPQGLHRFPIWYSITAVGLVLAMMQASAVPLNRAGDPFTGVFVISLLGGILLGGPIGIVVQNIDRRRQEQIRFEKGPLPSAETVS